MKGITQILAATAACCVVPVAASAAVATFSYSTFQYSPTSTGTYTTLASTGSPGAGYFVPLPAAGFLRFNLQVAVTGNPNAAAASTFETAQPALLGLNSFGQNITPSNANAIPVVGTGNRVVSTFDVRSNGSLSVNTLNGLSGGVLPANIDASDPATFNKATIGAAGAANVYTQQVVQIISNTVLNSAITDVAFVVNQTAGGAGVPPTYTARIAGAGDTIVGPGPIFFIPEPAGLAVVGLGGIGLRARRRKS